MRAASEAWHSKSFDGVGVAEICRLAKVNKGSFFHFFESKDALLLAVIERHASELRSRLEEGPFRRDAPPLVRMNRFFSGLAEKLREERRRTGTLRGCPIGNILSELATRDDAVRGAAARALDIFRATFADVLREAVADGSLPADVDVELGADAILAYMQGLALLSKAYRDPARLERLGQFVPVIFAGTRSRPAPKARRHAGRVKG